MLGCSSFKESLTAKLLEVVLEVGLGIFGFCDRGDSRGKNEVLRELEGLLGEMGGEVGGEMGGDVEGEVEGERGETKGEVEGESETRPGGEQERTGSEDGEKPGTGDME